MTTERARPRGVGIQHIALANLKRDVRAQHRYRRKSPQQDQQFSRLGSRSVIKVDVRILAATNINIPEALATKRLREDLYYRLNAFTLSLPPLRYRKEEIPILLKHSMTRMAERYARPPLPISPNLLKACQNHSWPGNLREHIRSEGLTIGIPVPAQRQDHVRI